MKKLERCILWVLEDGECLTRDEIITRLVATGMNISGQDGGISRGRFSESFNRLLASGQIVREKRWPKTHTRYRIAGGGP